jgi:hypothetical protein
MKLPHRKKFLQEVAGDTPLSLSASEFANLISAETEKWGKVVKLAGIKAE